MNTDFIKTANKTQLHQIRLLVNSRINEIGISERKRKQSLFNSREFKAIKKRYSDLNNNFQIKLQRTFEISPMLNIKSDFPGDEIAIGDVIDLNQYNNDLYDANHPSIRSKIKKIRKDLHKLKKDIKKFAAERQIDLDEVYAQL